MAEYAYRDKDRKERLYAADAVEEDRDKVFYCPNKLCGAKLIICSVDGSKDAYFRALGSCGHVAGCSFAESTEGFDLKKHDESSFNFDNAIMDLFTETALPKAKVSAGVHKIGSPQIHPLRTLREMYKAFKSLSPQAYYAGEKVGFMLLDDRSIGMHTRGCFGTKIVEAVVKGRIYDPVKSEIYLKTSVNTQKITLVLHFEKKDLFNKILKEILNNRTRKYAVAGVWKSDKVDRAKVEIKGGKQIWMVEKQKH